MFGNLPGDKKPLTKDFVNILLDIVGEYYKKGASIKEKDRDVYDACLNRISMAYDREELDEISSSRPNRENSLHRH